MSETTLFSHTANARIRTDDLFIDSDTPGIKLHIRRKTAADAPAPSEANTVLLMHAATYASESLYDLALAGPDGVSYSFMDYLAVRGYRVHALDVRGYGASTRPRAMADDAEDEPPAAPAATAVRDFATTVDWLCQTDGIEQLNVFAMSWGGTVAGAYAAADDRRVRRLALVAPQWLTHEATPLDAGGPLGAYRHVDIEAARSRWLGAAPADRAEPLVAPDTIERWFAIHLANEPSQALREAGRVRVPNGAIQDKRDYWSANKPVYDPARITAPVLLLHGEWDRDMPLDAAQAYFCALKGSRNKQWLELGAATHMLMLETPHAVAFDAVSRFFTG